MHRFMKNNTAAVGSLFQKIEKIHSNSNLLRPALIDGPQINLQTLVYHAYTILNMTVFLLDAMNALKDDS